MASALKLLLISTVVVALLVVNIDGKRRGNGRTQAVGEVGGLGNGRKQTPKENGRMKRKGRKPKNPCWYDKDSGSCEDSPLDLPKALRKMKDISQKCPGLRFMCAESGKSCALRTKPNGKKKCKCIRGQQSILDDKSKKIMECIMDVETFIYKAKKGSTKELGQLIKVITDSKASDDVLIQCLGSIKDCVTLLDEDHEMLVGVILKLDWASRGPDFCTVYASLICSLVSVHTDYVKAVLRMIIKQFKPAVDNDVTDETMVKDFQVFQNLHFLMHQILHMVPMSSKMVMPLLIDFFPYLNKSVYIQSCYLQNLFGIIQYLPLLRQQILELVIDKLMKIDVQLPKDEIAKGLETEAIDEESGVFNMEEEKPNLVVGETLDTLMTRLFEYIERVCFNQGVLDWDATKRLYREMLFIFEKIILTTHGSNHVQFVFFYFCSLKSEICDGFLDFLWKLVQNPNIQAIFRQYAVLYIGSLLARGKFVSIVTVMNMIDLMVSWLHSYTKMSSDSVMANYKYHGPFYSVCQSVFYVFAFRQKEIFNLKKGLKWAESLQFQHLIQSRLNPLKFCLPIIVDTFSSITRQHQLAFCDHIIQQNKRHVLSNISNQAVIESFFPFDPYLLEKSAVFIKKNYRDYDQSVHIGDSDSSDDDEDDNDDEDIFSDEGMGTGATDNSLTKSMLDIMEYGTSPGFSNVKHKS